MADVTNYTTMDLANMILQEKTNKITPENIRHDVQIFDIVGNYKGDTGASYRPRRIAFCGVGLNTYNQYTMTHPEYNGKNLDVFDCEHIDTSNVQNLEFTFYYTRNINTLRGLQNWNTCNITDLGNAFNGLYYLQNVNELANWNTSNVYSLYNAFNGCFNLTDISGLANWNVSNIVNLTYTFDYCTNLIDLSPLSNWYMPKLTSLNGTFMNCYNLISVPGDYTNVRNMYSTFNGCTNLTNLDNAINILNDTVLSYTFSGTHLTSLSTNVVNNCYFNYGSLPQYNNLSYINNSVTFTNCTFNCPFGGYFGKLFDANNIDFVGVNCNMHNYMTGMYSNGYIRSDSLLSGTGNFNITNACIDGWFYYQQNIVNVGNIQLRNCNNAYQAYSMCTNINNISNMNIHFASKTDVNLCAMFTGCTRLVDTTAMENWTFTDMSSQLRYINIYYMFGQCNNLSNDSLYAITNFFLLINANVLQTNLSNASSQGPFYSTNIQINQRLNNYQLNRLYMAGYRGFGTY